MEVDSYDLTIRVYDPSLHPRHEFVWTHEFDSLEHICTSSITNGIRQSFVQSNKGNGDEFMGYNFHLYRSILLSKVGVHGDTDWLHIF